MFTTENKSTSQLAALHFLSGLSLWKKLVRLKRFFLNLWHFINILFFLAWFSTFLSIYTCSSVCVSAILRLIGRSNYKNILIQNKKKPTSSYSLAIMDIASRSDLFIQLNNMASMILELHMCMIHVFLVHVSMYCYFDTFCLQVMEIHSPSCLNYVNMIEKNVLS